MYVPWKHGHQFVRVLLERTLAFRNSSTISALKFSTSEGRINAVIFKYRFLWRFFNHYNRLDTTDMLDITIKLYRCVIVRIYLIVLEIKRAPTVFSVARLFMQKSLAAPTTL